MPYPEKKEFGYELMADKEKRAFDLWYANDMAEKGGLYDFRREIVDYCRMDVTVLRRCCQKFCEVFRTISGGMHPFATALTIAGVCSAFWRTKILKEKQIGLVPDQSYQKNRLQSKKAINWLEWTKSVRGLEVEHRGNGAEKKIGPYYVDGFCEEGKVVFEFYGCWYHGCKSCYKGEVVHPYRRIPMSEIFAETVQRQQFIADQGYTVESIWEHEYDELIKQNADFEAFASTVEQTIDLNPRDAFFGGRLVCKSCLFQVASFFYVAV